MSTLGSPDPPGLDRAIPGVHTYAGPLALCAPAFVSAGRTAPFTSAANTAAPPVAHNAPFALAFLTMVRSAPAGASPWPPPRSRPPSFYQRCFSADPRGTNSP